MAAPGIVLKADERMSRMDALKGSPRGAEGGVRRLCGQARFQEIF